MKFEQEALTLSQKKPRERANKPKDGDQNLDDKNEFSAEENNLFSTASDLIKQRKQLKLQLNIEKEEIKKKEIEREIRVLRDNLWEITHNLYERRGKFISLLHAEKEETEKEKMRRKIRIFFAKEKALSDEDRPEVKEKNEYGHSNYINLYNYLKETDEEIKRREEEYKVREEAKKKYEDDYIASFSKLGFEEGKLEKPPKWQPQENQKEEQLVNQAEFNAVEMIGGAITDEGDIKNGSTYFRELFHDKISAILGEKFADSCVDNNYYIPLKEEEIQNDLAEFINNLTDSKDIEKIIALKFIKDISYDSFDEEGGYHFNTFAMSSLLNRFKDEDVSILEKYFIKDTLHNVIEIRDGSPYSSGWEIESEKIIKKKKDFLKKEFGQISRPEKYHNNNFNKFRFQFAESQREILFSQKPTIFQEPVFYEGQDPKPVNYYKDSKIKIPSGHLIGVYDIECYISSPITPEVIGIYTEDGTLIGWKRIDDLKEKQENLINNVNEIKSEIGDISIDDLILFKASSSLGFRSYIQETLAIDLSTVNIKNQLYFLNFIQGKTEEELSRFREFIKKSKDEQGKVNKLKTFLSIEQGGEKMGEKILALGDKLPEESCKVLFKTYGEMVDATNDVADLLKSNLGEKATPELIQSTQESLLLSGKDLLERYAGKAETCEGISCEEIGQELKDRLSLAKRSVFAFSHACKVLVERGEFSFEDFQKAKLSYDQSPLPEEMQNKIIAMHEENTKQYPEGLKNRWRGTLRDGLANKNPDQLVVSASYEDEVVAAMRVIKQKDGSWYGASFNVNPTVQGSRIGTELLKEVLKTLAKDKPFVADCYSKNPMLKTYLEKFGFKITKEIENYEGTGELVYQITIFPEKTK